MMELKIWHTNDIHSRFERLGAIAGYLRTHASADDLILDAGDLADERSLIVAGTGGAGALRLLKAAGYTAMAIGNNEFFAGPEKMTEMSRQGVELLSCNMTDLERKVIPGIRSHMIIEKAGMRILVIGISPYRTRPEDATEFTDMAGIKIEDPAERIRKILQEEQGRYDISILLSHAGLRRDRELAAKLPADLIIGGHTHDDLEKGETVSGTFIHQSGRHGELLGLVRIQTENGRIIAIQAENIPNTFAEDELFAQLIREEEERGIEALKKPLYELDHDLHYDAFEECEACNCVADILRLEYGGDLSVINHGILSSDICRTVSRLSLLEESPSILNPTVVYWKGRVIREALKASFEPERIHGDGAGPGFRGDVLGRLAVSHNVQVFGRAERILISGEPLQDDRTYEVITSDYLFRGSGYEMLKGSEQKERYRPGYFRDMLERNLCRDGYAETAGIRRFRK